jgi:hypothetical protein
MFFAPKKDGPKAAKEVPEGEIFRRVKIVRP